MDAGLLVTALAAGITLTGGAALIGVPKIAAFRLSLTTMGISAKTAAIATLGVGTAVAAATIGISYLVGKQAEAAATTEELASTLDAATGATTDYTRAAIAKKLSDDGVFDAARKAGVGQKELTDAILEGGDALDEVQRKIGETNTLGNLFDGTAIKADLAGRSINSLRDSLEDAPKKLEDISAAGVEAEDGLSGLPEGFDELGAAAEDAGSEIETLKEQIEGFGAAELSVRDAVRQLESAFDDVTASTEEHGSTLDVTTEAGRANQAALDAVARSALDVASSTLVQTESQEAATAALADGRQKLIESLAQFGITGQAAEEYADKLGLIPSNIRTEAQLATDAAAAALEAFRAREAAKPVRIVAQVSTSGARSTLGGLTQADGGVVDYYADGGVRENHVAQIAPAGAWRVWAEEETDGEAYIPFAKSKRARSLAIWAETGRRLEAFADGDIYQPNRYVSGAAMGPVSIAVDTPAASADRQRGDYRPTYVLPPGITARDVERISEAERNFEMRSN